MIYPKLVGKCVRKSGRERLGGSVHEASAFSSGHDPGVQRMSPLSGSLLSEEAASPSLSAVPPACALSYSAK